MSKTPERILVVDTETTGTWPLLHSMFEVSFLEVSAEGEAIWPEIMTLKVPMPDSWRTYADEKALEVNGYTLNYLPPTVKKFNWDEFNDIVNGAMLIGANVQFDVAFINKFLDSYPETFRTELFYKHLDVQAMALGRDMPGTSLALPSLRDLAKRFGIEQPAAHTSKGDVETTYQVLRNLVGL